MHNLIPEVKHITESGAAADEFVRIAPDLGGVTDSHERALAEKVVGCRLGDLLSEKGDSLTLAVQKGFTDARIPAGVDLERLRTHGYSLEISQAGCTLRYSSAETFVNALSTLKQLIVKTRSGFSVTGVSIFDYPSVLVRSMSTTFAWYAGYGRIGFDSQLWGLDEWKRFLDECADYKINQLNMCMYGYWPFELPEYPETCLRNIPMRVWNAESGNYIDILYTHPNLVREFLPELIEYAHLLSIRIFTYVGLNSYNGGFSNIHKDKRMKLPAGGKFVNDFDSLCLSDPVNIDYLKKAMRRIVRLGLDGIVFEESEEAYWFCQCDACRKAYVEKTSSAAEAKHEANYVLLETLHAVIKEENPRCEVGLRAWREPPLEKTVEYLQHCKASIPPDVSLYWAPGLYIPESEFAKWISVFGKDRICGRDTEANAWTSTQGRLVRIFKSNVLRSDEETNDQFIEKDIEQHKGSVKHGVRGINGYLFEYYGYFLHVMAHANFGWGSALDEKSFYERAVQKLFGEELAADVRSVLTHMLTIHESQLKLFPAEFPFLRNNVSQKDVPAIQEAQKEWPRIGEKIERIIAYCDSHPGREAASMHFKKIRNAHFRNRHIYELCLLAVRYDNEKDEEKKKALLNEMERCNEADFALVREMFFDILPCEMTGIRSCMYPYHELKRVIDNALGRNDPPDEQMIYLGVEALGWLWI
jgi:hypothetical protein